MFLSVEFGSFSLEFEHTCPLEGVAFLKVYLGQFAAAIS